MTNDAPDESDTDSPPAAEAVLETVRENAQTELSRLGSSKSLYADTGGEIETEPVLEATADAEYAAWQTFSAWADDEPETGAREAFETTAAEEREHLETVLGTLESRGDGDFAVESYDPTATPALHDYLRTLESTPERVGGFLGRILASKRSKEQVVGYFVGDADPQTAAVFREFGDDLDGQLERAEALVTEYCSSDADREQAIEAATEAIETAYTAYVENLEALGANPKPVC
ncbi:rubrerythrin family protein [Natrialba sp. SSL1]|uniref:rubrerythrin family protein n=1 Tax=Natrialba sp. SSL1 TaxID=1869245 RepID=UPI0008F9112B|nr:rubrerythrin family protein [Natrialba sp. SSL1]OIB55415.1 rubrerythrin family protein [Natrialba sp. SSL1]